MGNEYGNLIMREDEADSSKAYYVTNGHGDVTEIRNASRGVVNSYEYDIWGNVIKQTGDLDNPFLYSGEYWDGTTKLQYLRARWYDPSIGRFISEDTYKGQVDNPLSLNLYTYVYNNPLKYVDPTGHCPYNPFSQKFWDCAKKAFKDGGKMIWEDIKDTGDAIWSFGEAALEYVGPGTGVKTSVTYAIKNGKEVWIVAKDGVKRASKNIEELILKQLNKMPGKIEMIKVSESKMYQLGDHFNKHGRNMGYGYKKEYDAAAKEFAKVNQSNSKATIVEGT